MKTISRYIMTLALLLTAVTGAWADGEIVVTVTAADLQADQSNPFTKDGVTIKCSDRMTGGLAFNELNEMSTTLGYFTKIEITNQFPEGISGINGVNGFSVNGSVATWTGKASSVGLGHYSVGPVVQFVFTIEPAEPPLTVDWDATTKTGTFTMPGSDVVLTPIYAKAAAFATTGTEPEVKPLLPEAAEGVIAGTDASLIAEGTGIVAFAGESTEVTQGTLMYAIGTSATEAPAPAAFSATVPTAKNIPDDGADVYVWYYIQGADAPDGVAATLDNTFDNTEPACLTATVLTNKFDITLKAANANTIEAGKATVTVGGTAATVTDGKLQGVKMGSEVKVKANTGYKFRKVEVKKAASTPTLKDALKDGATVVITYTWQGAITTFTYTNNGGNYTGNTSGYEAEYFANGMTKDGTTLKFTASNPDLPQANVSIDFFTDSNEYLANKGSAFDSFTISVNGTDVTSQLTEVK